MQAIHKTLLEVNEEFLVSEAPAEPVLRALHGKHVLNDLDLEQLRFLDAQGPRAVKRFVLHVLPLRGLLAFPAYLESLQEAKAQHLVDLLLEEEAVLRDAVKPIELPEKQTPAPPKEDPNEYARKLRANLGLIEDAVEPNHVIPSLLQANVLSPLEQRLLHEVSGQPALTWSIIWAVLMQRGITAYNAFMGALLQHDYSALFHTIQETKVTGMEALQSTLTRNLGNITPVRTKRRTPITPEPTPYHPTLAPTPTHRPLSLRDSSSEHPQVHRTPEPSRIPRYSPQDPRWLTRSVRRSSEGDVHGIGTGSQFQGPVFTLSPSPPKSNKPRSASDVTSLRRSTRFSSTTPLPSIGQPQSRARLQQERVVPHSSSLSVAAERRIEQQRRLRTIQYSLGPRQFREFSSDDVQTEEGLRSRATLSRLSRREREDMFYSPTWSERFDHLRKTDTASPRLSIGRFTPSRVDAARSSSIASWARRNSNPDQDHQDNRDTTEKETKNNRLDYDDHKENSNKEQRRNSDDKENDEKHRERQDKEGKHNKDREGKQDRDREEKQDKDREERPDKENSNNNDGERGANRRRSLASLGPDAAFGMGPILESDSENERPGTHTPDTDRPIGTSTPRKQHGGTSAPRGGTPAPREGASAPRDGTHAPRERFGGAKTGRDSPQELPADDKDEYSHYLELKRAEEAIQKGLRTAATPENGRTSPSDGKPSSAKSARRD